MYTLQTTKAHRLRALSNYGWPLLVMGHHRRALWNCNIFQRSSRRSPPHPHIFGHQKTASWHLRDKRLCLIICVWCPDRNSWITWHAQSLPSKAFLPRSAAGPKASNSTPLNPTTKTRFSCVPSNTYWLQNPLAIGLVHYNNFHCRLWISTSYVSRVQTAHSGLKQFPPFSIRVHTCSRGDGLSYSYAQKCPQGERSNN